MTAVLKITQGDVSVYAHYNPREIKIKSGYEWEKVEGDAYSISPNLKTKKNAIMSIEFLLDDYKPLYSNSNYTGFVSNSTDEKARNTATSLSIIYSMAEPVKDSFKPVTVNLGSMIFKAVITDITANITATNDNLSPTRATVEIQLTQFWDEGEDPNQPLVFI